MESSYIIERDVSWLYFNHRVLQEAMDKNVPLYERIKFLAIYSNNLDEFFQVRVAALKSLAALAKSERKEYTEDVKPKRALRQIRTIVSEQQELFGKVFREEIIPSLEAAQIFLVKCDEFTDEQQTYAYDYFQQHLQQPQLLTTLLLNSAETGSYQIKNKALYFAVFFESETTPAIVEIPTDQLPRFIVLPQKGNAHQITFLDDIIRCNMHLVFPKTAIRGIYSIKLSRDTDLHLEDEFEGDITEHIQRSLDIRNIGVPTRFLYDGQIPSTDLTQLLHQLQLKPEDAIPGARYHNFNDFFQFPDPTNNPSFRDEPLPPLPHPVLEQATDTIIHLLQYRDILLHFPYQSYEYVPRLIMEAASDPKVEHIRITLYRVASKSEVGEALLYARAQEKNVTVFVEAKARFDEASNLTWGKKLKAAGATVIYSFKFVKVHTKLLLISRNEEGVLRYYTYVATGNFNEKTAKLYTDHALMTSSKSIGKEVKQIFDLLERKILIPKTKDILVSPFTTRSKFEKLIQREIKYAKAGKSAYLIAKMNSLEDADMIEQLVEASQTGVQITLIVRGICRLVPGIKGYTENIKVISIIDRFLEHGRVYIFGNDGKEVMYIASADWMKRNLDWRVEVAVPIKDATLQEQLRHLIDIQLKDNLKARQIVASQTNPYVEHTSKLKIRAQTSIYDYLQQMVEV